MPINQTISVSELVMGIGHIFKIDDHYTYILFQEFAGQK